MFFDDPFPKTAAWAEANLPAADAAELQEHLEDVRYHLALGADAETNASAAMRPRQWALSYDESAIYVIGFEPLNVVRFGDIAIREAASGLDLGLQYTNRALKAGVIKKDVRWSRGRNEAPLRAALGKMASAEATALVAVIDALFGSIGLDLLHGYRHWVTHRGAPRVRLEHAIGEGIPVTDEIRAEEDDRRKKWLIETHLLSEIPSAIRIACHPFVPPVQAVVNMSVDEATEDIEIPGFIYIGKGAKNIEIRDSRITTGSAMESAEDFKKKNPILLEESTVKVAGEDLAVYKVWDYLHALVFVTRFVGKALSGEWDERLAVALAAHFGSTLESS